MKRDELLRKLGDLEEWAEGMAKGRERYYYNGYADGLRDVIKMLGGDPMRELKRRFKRVGLDYSADNTSSGDG